MEEKRKTIAQSYGPAMEIETQEEADRYFEELVDYHVAHVLGRSRADAAAIEKSNLGYYAGYCSHETRERVERLFKCSHPIFGSIAKNGAPTPESAFAAGMKAGKALKVDF